ncbi:universal stress protein [Inmirania thermothiophila]|uniref:Nucleotide-binding universal stress UspA family protein n=1 Tax=Inmirania thermothiophila TaxID=1750597 RepID=A0A3N1Y201_9GAMM|nr:universal stress protein [Inmirania thermothiophila]ROR32865.1 nucleotide-binding universal stress UspA family protein [Inmirania thermothiophila]
MMPEYRKVLCAVEVGEHGEPVVAHAAGLALRYGAALTVLHVVEAASGFAEALVEEHIPHETRRRIWEEGLARIRGELEAMAARVVARDLGGRSPAPLAARVAEGRPAAVILALAEETGADLIVLGSHGRSTLGEVLVGSTAHRVSQRARVPVLLVPLR